MDKKKFHKIICRAKNYTNLFNDDYNTLTRKSFHFDLDTNLLKIHYVGGKKYNKAYYDIKSFMKEYGFEHEQGSGYTSIKPMSDTEAIKIATELKATFPWIKKCVKVFTVTDYHERKNITDLMTDSDASDRLTKKNEIEKQDPVRADFTISRKQMNDIAKKCSESSYEKARSKRRQKNEPIK